MDEKGNLSEDAKFYEILYRKALERYYDETKKHYQLVTKHNRLKDWYDDIRQTNIRLWICLGVSTLLNVLFLMWN